MNNWLEEYKSNPKEIIPPRKSKDIIPNNLKQLLPFVDVWEDRFITVGGRERVGIAITDQSAWKIIKDHGLKTSKSNSGWFIVIS